MQSTPATCGNDNINNNNNNDNNNNNISNNNNNNQYDAVLAKRRQVCAMQVNSLQTGL